MDDKIEGNESGLRRQESSHLAISLGRRIHVRHRMSLILLLIMLAAPRNPGRVMELDCAQGVLDFQTLYELGRTKSVSALEQTYRAIPIPDSVERLVFGCRRQKLAPGRKADQLLLSSLPRTRVEFNLIYMLTFPNAPSTEDLGEIGDGGWFQQSADAVLRLKQLPREFLMQGYFAVGYAHLENDIAFEQSRVCKSLAKLCATQMATLPSEVREHVCIGCELADEGD